MEGRARNNPATKWMVKVAETVAKKMKSLTPKAPRGFVGTVLNGMMKEGMAQQSRW